ncbi:MAG: hypothetical protein ACT4N2_03220 [Hyphomicrobium sp.]
MTIAADKASAATPSPAAGDPNPRLVRALKIAVIGMGVLILAGLAAVIWRIVDLASSPASKGTGVHPAMTALTDAPSSASPAALTESIALALPAGAVVRSTSLSGHRLAVHYDAPSGPAVAILDLETGRRLSTVGITTGSR